MNDTSPRRSKCDQIVEAACKLFLESGYETTSMDAIATEANVSKRTVYSYFENKEVLFGAIMKSMCDNTGCTHPDTLNPDLPLKEALKEFARNMVGLTQTPEQRDVFRVVLAEGIKFPELGKTFWDSGPELAKQILAAYLTEQISRGVLAIEDPEVAAMQFIGMVKWPHSMPELFGIKGNTTPADRQRALDQAISIFTEGTRAKS